MAAFNARPRFYRLCLLVAVTASAVAGQARGQQPDSAGDKLTALRLEWHTQHAHLEVAEEEAKLTAPPRTCGGIGQFQDASPILNELRPVLAPAYATLGSLTLKLAEDAAARRAAVQKNWADVYRQRVAFHQYTDQQQAAYGFDFDSGDLPGFRPSILDAAIIVWAGVVFVVALGLGRHVRRVTFRKAARTTLAVGLLAAFAVPGCGSKSTDTRPWVAREEDELTAARDKDCGAGEGRRESRRREVDCGHDQPRGPGGFEQCDG